MGTPHSVGGQAIPMTGVNPVRRPPLRYIEHNALVAMDETHQTEIPASFIALYMTPGQARPKVPHALALQRYELCEDMAQALTETAQALHFRSAASHREVLQCLQEGLDADDAALQAGEAQWIIRRLAELLNWPLPSGASL